MAPVERKVAFDLSNFFPSKRKFTDFCRKSLKNVENHGYIVASASTENGGNAACLLAQARGGRKVSLQLERTLDAKDPD